MLLKAGANPNPQLKLFPPYRSLRDDRGADTVLTVGATPLLRAAKAGDIAAMKLLLTHGANPSLPTATGVTPLMAAAGNGSSNLDTRGRYKTEAQAVDAVNVLLASGVDINQRDNNGQTALYGAATWGWNDLVKTLAARNADLVDQRRSRSYCGRHRNGYERRRLRTRKRHPTSRDSSVAQAIDGRRGRPRGRQLTEAPKPLSNARLRGRPRSASFCDRFPYICVGYARQTIAENCSIWPAVTPAPRAHRRSGATLAGSPCDACVAPLATAIITQTGSTVAPIASTE